ncbi:phosphoenolpyruvate synthase [Candidatus Woesearchaeota archaeon]|nr:phosphoenolpyruvate synthase [Candidatus Woesearchaeota archaeon]
MENILWLRDIKKENLNEVGGKGANLGEMYSIDLPVPPAFVITTQAYKNFLISNNIMEKIYDELKDFDVENNEELQRRAENCRNLILSGEIGEDLKNEIIEAYDAMNINEDILNVSKSALDLIKAGRSLPYVAVRSSATAEDLPTASFAGQQATILNVKGNRNLLNAVRECWASLFTARAVYYRVQNKFPHEKVFIAVIIQKQIQSTTAGVIFTVNPSTNDESEIVIEAGFGLGELVVTGQITPDMYIVNREGLTIKSKTVNEQDVKLILDPNTNQNIRKPIEEEDKKKQKLQDYDIIKLAELANKIEEHYKFPQDIEFATENSKLYIVQTRAVTTLGKVEEIKEKEEGKIILKGLAASPHIGTGKVKLVEDVNNLDKVEKGDVLVTKMTNPDYVVAMRRAIAIITDEGGISSHAAIVSRELGVACVVGTHNATQLLKENQLVTVDGSKGFVYEGAEEIKEELKEHYEPQTEIETITKVKVNCDLPEAVENALKQNPDGVGLLRLEFIIAEGKTHPAKYIKDGRDEEYKDLIKEGIRNLAKRFFPRPVWVRTSDIRTDEYRDLEGGEEEPKESNPMLGLHGIRRGLKDKGILRAEMKAIKELYNEGLTNISVMLPFVISPEEVKETKKILQELNAENIPLGVMIETPASVWVIEDICKEGISFVSFGTNDLTQTVLAVDRNNENLQYLYNELNPAVLRCINYVIKVCKKYNVETSICGQAGSNPEMAEILVKFGIDSISANIDAVRNIRNIVNKAEKRLMLEAARMHSE